MSEYPSVERSAVISDCQLFRYSLARRWAPGYLLPFVMLNPSTADALEDDPTIRRCMGFARREGFAGIQVVNLYAFRATKPADLWRAEDPVGPRNDRYLRSVLAPASFTPVPVVAAWGTNAKPQRVAEVLGLADDVDWRCLGHSKDGHPKHPLYIRADQPLEPLR